MAKGLAYRPSSFLTHLGQLSGVGAFVGLAGSARAGATARSARACTRDG